MTSGGLSWLGIARLGLVQTALGAIVVLTTSTMNRVMVVELALPAMLPGALVAFHYAVQISRPRLGYGSDMGGRRTPWIVGGMAALAAGGIGAALATAWMETNTAAGIALAVVAFALVGGGVGASGTSLLVLLAKRVDAHRRPAAAMVVWLMMIAGFAVTAASAGQMLDPFSPARLIAVTATVAGAAFLLTVVAVRGLEGPVERAGAARAPKALGQAPAAEDGTARPRFREALAQVWAEPQSRQFAIFVFVSMLAYSAQDLILEPFAGEVFGMTPGESTRLAGTQHGGVFVGMLIVGVLGSRVGRSRGGAMRAWTIGGCLASGVALAGLAVAGFVGPAWPLQISVFALGAANGAYAVAAIGSMMGLAYSGRAAREGVRMGLWGAAQAVAFGVGGFMGTMAIDVARFLFGAPVVAYATAFGLEAMLFLLAAVLAARLGRTPAPAQSQPRASVALPVAQPAASVGGR